MRERDMGSIVGTDPRDKAEMSGKKQVRLMIETKSNTALEYIQAGGVWTGT
jgi:hypothetical protein